jgi:YidC/Oxa1 family membrane protein insertase
MPLPARDELARACQPVLVAARVGRGHWRPQPATFDLAISPSEALQEGFLTALPYLSLVLVIGGLSWYQSKQIAGRNKASEMAPQQKMMMRIGPAMFVVIAFAMPAALGVYFLVSTIWRVGQQAYITHSLYKGEDSVGAQAQKAMADARADREKQKTSKSTSNGAKKSSAKTGAKTGSGAKAGSGGKSGKSGGNGAESGSERASTTGAVTSGAGDKAKPHPRSKKKKKRK